MANIYFSVHCHRAILLFTPVKHPVYWYHELAIELLNNTTVENTLLVCRDVNSDFLAYLLHCLQTSDFLKVNKHNFNETFYVIIYGLVSLQYLFNLII